MPPTDGESMRKESVTTVDQESLPRPVRDATVRGCHKVQRWTNTLQAPRRMSWIGEHLQLLVE